MDNLTARPAVFAPPFVLEFSSNPLVLASSASCSAARTSSSAEPEAGLAFPQWRGEPGLHGRHGRQPDNPGHQRYGSHGLHFRTRFLALGVDIELLRCPDLPEIYRWRAR